MTENAEVMWDIVDPLNNYVYDVRQYPPLHFFCFLYVRESIRVCAGVWARRCKLALTFQIYLDASSIGTGSGGQSDTCVSATFGSEG